MIILYVVYHSWHQGIVFHKCLAFIIFFFFSFLFLSEKTIFSPAIAASVWNKRTIQTSQAKRIWKKEKRTTESVSIATCIDGLCSDIFFFWTVVFNLLCFQVYLYWKL